jgi:branched-chain amino acid transport system ATP-binding protein
VTFFSVDRLQKRFGDRVVLHDISFGVEDGEVRGIVGPNGAGKTTCFHVLTGRYKPDGGIVTFDGHDVTGLPPYAIARRGIARSFQLMNLFDDYSVLENVLVATPELRSRGLDMLGRAARPGPAIDRAYEALSDVGLVERAARPARSLPYGERRALEIAVALACAPRLMFLDEPTAGLGAEGIERLAALISRLRGRITLIVIEHDMRFLFGLADRISVVHWGQVIASGTPDELRANPWVARSQLATAGIAA